MTNICAHLSMHRRPARVLIADDHGIMAESLRSLLKGRYDVVGIVGDGRAAVQMAEQLEPDLVLLDIAMPRMDGIEAAMQLRTVVPDAKIVFVTHHSDRNFVAAAFDAGARGYLLKCASQRELLSALDMVLRGHTYIYPGIPKLWAAALARRGGPGSTRSATPLSDRQREVLERLAQGMTPKEIAWTLGISSKTVEFHKARIMSVLELHTTAELTRYAVKHGLVRA